MQREMRWTNWPILLVGVVLVIGLILGAFKIENNHVMSNYLEDVAGALTLVVLSIATYDEWERRRERKRYVPPERMGVQRIKEEVSQLLYQYAFVLSLRWDPQSEAMKTVERATSNKEFSEPETELHAKSAKHIYQENPKVKRNLFRIAGAALDKPVVAKQTYRDVNELILQTERSIDQLDMAIAIYGYSFTPEVHKWALDIRENLSQTISGKLAILSIRLAAVSKDIDVPVRANDVVGIMKLIQEITAVARHANDLEVNGAPKFRT